MNFDKETYWKNRKAGLRGQGLYPNPVNKVYTPKEWQEQKEKERLKWLINEAS